MSSPPFGTFASILEERAADSPDRPFLTAGGATATYAELAEDARRLAGALHGLGIRKGDNLALFLPSGIPFALCMFASARLGAPFVPVHAQSTARELVYVLQHADAALVVTDAERLPLVEQVRGACPRLRHVVVTGRAGNGGLIAFEELLRHGEEPPDAAVDPDDAAAILYTSGTTGRPKGAILTHRGYVLNAAAFAERVLMQQDDVVLCVLPLSHLNAQRSSLLPAALARARVVLTERFSATEFWPAVRAHGVTFFSIMPTIVSILLERPPEPDERRHRVRLCVTPITPPLLEAFEARFGIPVVNTYGLTEGMLNVMNFVDAERRRPAAIGKPLAPEIHSVRIVADDERELGSGVTGEIVLRSPAMTAGYHKDPEATALLLRGGWLHTGDLGFLDAEGYLHFVGRKKEMIRRGGENVAPAEIEAVLAAHPKVREVVAVGVPDPIREEEVKACVVLREGEDAESVPPAELLAYCSERLAAFKVPRYIEYRRELPRTPATLRVQRHALVVPGGRLFDRASGSWVQGPAAR